MKHHLTNIISSLSLSLLIGQTAWAMPVVNNADFAAAPPGNNERPTPLVMLTMSRDHQYFFKAYNDYTDLDLDLTVETTYKHSFNYFGYFDSEKCYTYNSGQGRFNPVSIATTKYCNGQWSGNFLNWASMTRMDVVRKILYGGKRSTDTRNSTILERAYLPTDAHSFAKYYNGDDIALLTPYQNVRSDGENGGDGDGFDDLDEGITLCNTTYDTSGASQQSTEPPLIRVAQGNFQLWAANERWQCTWGDERGVQRNANIPPSAPIDVTIGTDTFSITSGIDASSSDPDEVDDNGEEFIARVAACVDGLRHLERCQEYPDGNFKPIGLLQEYSETGLIDFGLMTGSYENNIQGGVLRKNISSFASEVNTSTDGTFSFTATSDSIVKTLDSLRPWGYNYGDGTYRGNGQFDDCSFQLNGIPNGRCNSWGNPISEIFKETIRYYAGLAPDGDFTADDTSFIANLTTADWDDNPLDDDNRCSDLSAIIINASVSSYDDDQISINGVRGANATTTQTWTNRVGDAEGITGNDFFIGSNGTNNNERCDAKTINRFSDAEGICPEAATVRGSFAMAGIAYYAHNNDINDDLDGSQKVNTFAVSLATNTPVINVPRSDGGTPVSILPAYELQTATPGGGALVDFKIVKPHTRQADGTFTASYYVNWEDSEQGGDYDQDMWGLIDYVLNETNNTIEVTTTAVGQSTANPQLFGFVISGTTQDGFHAYSGILGANFTSPFAGVPGCTNCRELINSFNGNRTVGGQEGPQSYTFSINNSNSVASLRSPLYYAAKYGGFEENLDPTDPTDQFSPSDVPDEQSEWDRFDNTDGTANPDGIPDNFFSVINPAELETSLERIFLSVLATQERSGTAPANLANADGTAGLIVQALYNEKLEDSNNRQVVWTGDLQAFFIDEFGNFRADSPNRGTPGLLDDYSIDYPFSYTTDDKNTPNDPSDDEVLIQRLRLQNPTQDFDLATNTLVSSGQPFPLRNLDVIWSAEQALSDLENNSIITQRGYGARVANTGPSRFIFTNQNGATVPLTQESIQTGALNYRYLGVDSRAQATNIVNFVRGYDDPLNGLRRRSIDLDENNQEEILRLGDIVNSTPLFVGRPGSSFDTEIGDDSYTAFRLKYQDRRNMVYVGGNDGLIHAFNVGFRSEDRPIGFQTNDTNSVRNGTAHPLGSEVWAYAPQNLLPHLQWLTREDYIHVFYADGEPQAFDVRIFPDDATHPNGWGTILVVGMRLGGGDFPINLDDNPSNDTPTCGDFCTRSAYVVLDITDPEAPPRLLAEITHPDLNFTIGTPSLVKRLEPDSGGSWDAPLHNQWWLAFGSGPNNVRTFNTNESAKIFLYDLQSNQFVTRNTNSINYFDVPATDNSFVGNPVTVDYEQGSIDDTVYFGTSGTTATGGEKGAMFRMQLGHRTTQNSEPDIDVNLFFNTFRPISQTPLPLIVRDRQWLYFGTGRFYHKPDGQTSSQESYYGIMEPIDSDSQLTFEEDIDRADLLNVTGLRILSEPVADATGSTLPEVSGQSFPNLPSDVDTFEELQDHILNEQTGWLRNLPRGAQNSNAPSARVFTNSNSFASQLFFVDFIPSNDDDICSAEREFSNFYALNLLTGTASPFDAFGLLEGVNPDLISDPSITFEGRLSSPLFFSASGLGANTGRIIFQRGDGRISNPVIRTGAPPRRLRLSWRELFFN